MNIKLLFLFLILIISISVLFYYTFSSSTPTDYNVNNINLNYDKKIENEIESKKVEIKKIIRPQLILYWANWCGICNKIKPNWEAAKIIIKEKYPDVEIIDVNCDDAKLDKCYVYMNGEKTNLDGVPTIIMRKNNSDVEYKKGPDFKGDRSVEELVRFCKNNI